MSEPSSEFESFSWRIQHPIEFQRSCRRASLGSSHVLRTSWICIRAVQLLPNPRTKTSTIANLTFRSVPSRSPCRRQKLPRFSKYRRHGRHDCLVRYLNSKAEGNGCTGSKLLAAGNRVSQNLLVRELQNTARGDPASQSSYLDRKISQ